ncbi:mannosyltransferase putative-domain-containing protein [Biscogniauxia marginata]|nr:mannosyltransferase putative-domain-containing protein [Biscogniauxia marginata]
MSSSSKSDTYDKEHKPSSQTISPSWGSYDRSSFEEALRKVISMLPDEVHMRELTRPIDGGGKERMREMGIRTRSYRAYFEAWENLHLGDDETGAAYVRDDIIQYLRAHQDPSSPVHTTPGGHSKDIRDNDGIQGDNEVIRRSQRLTQTIHAYESFRSFMTGFANFLFPWTSPYFADHMSLHTHFKTGGRGIVLTAGDNQAPWLLTTIYSFQKLGCKLPIEVMYLGESDLGDDYRAELEALPGVTTRDISQMVNDEGWTLAGWAVKPFAILLSSFREVIFIDADSLFFKDPETLFEDSDYRRTGALFFRDRVFLPESKKRWLQQVMPKPVPKLAKQSSWWTGESGHMQESGVIVIDKWRHFVAMLLICRFNGSERDTRDGKEGVYDMMYGDKETFWIGFLLAGDESYAFHRGETGTMGIVEPPKKAKDDYHTQTGDDDETTAASGMQEEERDGDHEANDPQPPTGDEKRSKKKRKTLTICAPQLVHLSVGDGRPLWFNGWLLRDKYAGRSEQRFAEVRSYITEPRQERDQGGPDNWVLGDANVGCLTSDADRMTELSEAELGTFDMMVERAKEVAMTDINDD